MPAVALWVPVKVMFLSQVNWGKVVQLGIRFRFIVTFQFPFSILDRRQNLGSREPDRVPLRYSRELNIDTSFIVLRVVLATDEVRKIRQDKICVF
jgi:hypothetical protein